MLSEPPRCRPFPVRALKGADSPRGLHRGHSPGHGAPQVLEAQGVVGRSRQVGPIRTAYDSSIRITMRGTGGQLTTSPMAWKRVSRLKGLAMGRSSPALPVRHRKCAVDCSPETTLRLRIPEAQLASA